MAKIVTLMISVQEVAEFVHGYPQSLQANDGIVLKISPPPFASTSSPMYY
jgi:hypothetical protein